MSDTAALSASEPTSTHNEPPKDDELDAAALSALVASRVCHDLINPVGALDSGLDVLEDETMDDVMKDAAIDLIKTGGKKSIALLKYARLAYGAAGGRGAELPLEEAGLIMEEVFEWAKASLEWRLPATQIVKEKVKTVMILTHFAADCVPRGGVVRVTSDDEAFFIEAEGRRALLQDDLVAALNGDHREMKPKFAPAYIAGMFAREAGGAVKVERVDEEKILFEARFGAA